MKLTEAQVRLLTDYSTRGSSMLSADFPAHAAWEIVTRLQMAGFLTDPHFDDSGCVMITQAGRDALAKAKEVKDGD